jgi:crossover junction endodeoxyribonuclease RusA
MIEARLRWPPSSNHFYAVVRGRKIISSAGRRYQEDSALLLLAQVPKSSRLTGRAGIHIRAFPPDHRKRDLDNLVKPVLDVLVKAHVIEDDSLFDDERITRGHTTPGGMIELTIWPLS